MSCATLHADPTSGIEVLCLDAGYWPATTPVSITFGVAYDPRRSSLPAAWRSDCRHCLMGRTRNLSTHTKREIQLLLHRRSRLVRGQARHEYLIPIYGDSMRLVHWQSASGQHARVTRPEVEDALLVHGQPGLTRLEYEGDRSKFESSILLRCLRFLFSSRPADPSHVAACLAPLAEQQRLTPARPGYRNLCDKIDWVTAHRRALTLAQAPSP